MKRREFIALLGGAVAAWPMAARTQQPTMPVIGFLSSSNSFDSQVRLAVLQQGLKDNGFIDGQNLKIEFRFADNDNDRLPAMAADLVRRQASVITAFGIPALAAAKAATATTPIVFEGGFDPVALGFVASLARPGGNITGVTTLGLELGPKRLELLHELLPAATTFALLINSANPTSAATQSKDLEAAANALGLRCIVVHARSERDFDTAFATLAPPQTGGLVISNDGMFTSRAEELGALALRYQVPAIFQFRPFASAGGLMSYGSKSTEGYRLAGLYVGRILKGEKPADLPVQRATKVELIINMNTAKALGITFPITLLGRADEVIE